MNNTINDSMLLEIKSAMQDFMENVYFLDMVLLDYVRNITNIKAQMISTDYLLEIYNTEVELAQKAINLQDKKLMQLSIDSLSSLERVGLTRQEIINFQDSTKQCIDYLTKNVYFERITNYYKIVENHQNDNLNFIKSCNLLCQANEINIEDRSSIEQLDISDSLKEIIRIFQNDIKSYYSKVANNLQKGNDLLGKIEICRTKSDEIYGSYSSLNPAFTEIVSNYKLSLSDRFSRFFCNYYIKYKDIILFLVCMMCSIYLYAFIVLFITDENINGQSTSLSSFLGSLLGGAFTWGGVLISIHFSKKLKRNEILTELVDAFCTKVQDLFLFQNSLIELQESISKTLLNKDLLEKYINDVTQCENKSKLQLSDIQINLTCLYIDDRKADILSNLIFINAYKYHMDTYSSLEYFKQLAYKLIRITSLLDSLEKSDLNAFFQTISQHLRTQDKLPYSELLLKQIDTIKKLHKNKTDGTYTFAEKPLYFLTDYSLLLDKIIEKNNPWLNEFKPIIEQIKQLNQEIAGVNVYSIDISQKVLEAYLSNRYSTITSKAINMYKLYLFTNE